MTDHGLDVRRFPDRTAMGRAAASDIAAFMRERLARTGAMRMIFAAAPSQSDMLAALVREPDIDWPAVTAFHMDEYPSLPPEAPQRFGNWLRRELFDLVPFGTIHLIETGEDLDTAARFYAAHLEAAPIDAVCRQQQVDDGAFASLGEVPTHGLTLTVPRLLRADRLFCTVPGPAKREAVRRTLKDPIGTACPATALRRHPACTLYLDADSAVDVS